MLNFVDTKVSLLGDRSTGDYVDNQSCNSLLEPAINVPEETAVILLPMSTKLKSLLERKKWIYTHAFL